VEWTVDPGGEPVAITGSGIYQVWPGHRPRHRLELDLSIAGEALEHFDSGLVAGGQKFPHFAITVSINERYCFDTVIAVEAMPNLGCPYPPEYPPAGPDSAEAPRFRPQHTDEWSIAPDPGPQGYLAGYEHGPCAAGRDGGGYPWCGEDVFSWISAKRTVQIVHTNAAYNCCVEDIVVALSSDGGVLRLTEAEVLPAPCDCLCCYEIVATLADLEPGDQALEYCWTDEELGATCTTLVITVTE
jgi:hypothetical protein